MRNKIVVASLILLAVRPLSAEAKLAAFELKDMVEGATAIVIATVETIEENGRSGERWCKEK